MKILIAKHYWKNGKNATWECHPKLDEKLFEYLKENYHNFVKNRKNKIKKDKYHIYFCYKDAKDDHGRDITNITFFISKSEVLINLCEAQYDNLELKIESKNNKNIIFIGIMAFFIIGYLGINFSKSEASTNQKIVQLNKSKDYDSLIENWNNQVQNIAKDNKTYLLTKDNIIEELNNWMKPFYEDINKLKYHEINIYREYIERFHTDDEKETFKIGMNLKKIKKILYKLTKTEEISEIVPIVLNMNDINIFLEKKCK